VKKMVGRELSDYYPEKNARIGEVAFEVEKLTGEGFEEASFYVREGEILGFSGLMGSGRTELMRAIFGLNKKTSGTIKIASNEIQITS
ncbi:ATP-binding cassette domain-containing protein, partial [Streptococcus pyogenes]